MSFSQFDTGAVAVGVGVGVNSALGSSFVANTMTTATKAKYNTIIIMGKVLF